MMGSNLIHHGHIQSQRRFYSWPTVAVIIGDWSSGEILLVWVIGVETITGTMQPQCAICEEQGGTFA